MPEPVVFLTWEQLAFIKLRLQELKSGHTEHLESPAQNRQASAYCEAVDDCVRIVEGIAAGRIR